MLRLRNLHFYYIRSFLMRNTYCCNEYCSKDKFIHIIKSAKQASIFRESQIQIWSLIHTDLEFWLSAIERKRVWHTRHYFYSVCLCLSCQSHRTTNIYRLCSYYVQFKYIFLFWSLHVYLLILLVFAHVLRIINDECLEASLPAN